MPFSAVNSGLCQSGPSQVSHKSHAQSHKDQSRIVKTPAPPIALAQGCKVSASSKRWLSTRLMIHMRSENLVCFYLYPPNWFNCPCKVFTHEMASGDFQPQENYIFLLFHNIIFVQLCLLFRSVCTCLSACVCVYIISTGAHKARRGCWTPGTGIMGNCGCFL